MSGERVAKTLWQGTMGKEPAHRTPAEQRKRKPGRPAVVFNVKAEVVAELRRAGKSWRQIAELHPTIMVASGRSVKPSVGSIRRAWALYRLNQEL